MSFLEKLKAVFTKSVPDSSEPGKLNSTDYAKLTRDFLIVSASAGTVWLSNNLHLIDLGEYSAALTPVLALILSAAIKFLKENGPTEGK